MNKLKIGLGNEFNLARESLKFPESLMTSIHNSNKEFDKHFKDLGVTYEGTDPLPDSKMSY